MGSIFFYYYCSGKYIPNSFVKIRDSICYAPYNGAFIWAK